MGDFGTLLPLAIGYFVINGLNPAGLPVMMGLFSQGEGAKITHRASQLAEVKFKISDAHQTSTLAVHVAQALYCTSLAVVVVRVRLTIRSMPLKSGAISISTEGNRLRKRVITALRCPCPISRSR
ncbi:hypothetical protein ES703_76918 [subsurface metagenome]